MKKALILSCMLLPALVGGPASAHAKLLDSKPAKDSQLSHSPAELTLHFSEAAKLAVLKLACGGTDIATGDRPSAGLMTVTVKLPPLPAGLCTVNWSALAVDDGHVTHGSFSFTVTAP
jgi:methionine-rich copper-binding protein CopC